MLFLFIVCLCQLFLNEMSSLHDLTQEEEITLIKDKERGLLDRELSDKFKLSLGTVSSVLKRTCEYTIEYE
jgi:hypothetical protein